MDSPDCLLLLLSYRTKGYEKSPTRRNVTPYPICIKFCMLVGIPDIITDANFGYDRLRGFRVVGIDFPHPP